MVMRRKMLLEDQFDSLIIRIRQMKSSGRDNEIKSLLDELENNLHFCGISAVEERLQEGVSDIIFTLLTCKITIWMLTGDNAETAKLVSISIKLINDNMFIKNFCEKKTLIQSLIISVKIIKLTYLFHKRLSIFIVLLIKMNFSMRTET